MSIGNCKVREDDICYERPELTLPVDVCVDRAEVTLSVRISIENVPGNQGGLDGKVIEFQGKGLV